MSRRRLRILAPAVALALIAVAALAVSAGASRTVREFSLRSPDQRPVVALHRRDRVCEGPVGASRTVTGVQLWGGSALGVSRVRVDVERAGRRTPLASGALSATGYAQSTVALDRPVAAGTPVRVCVTGVLNTFQLFGSQAVDPRVQMGGQQAGFEFSLSLTGHRSLLDALSLAFQRASLWKLSWVGGWTFWVLAIALLAGFAVAVAAVAAAAAEDGEEG